MPSFIATELQYRLHISGSPFEYGYKTRCLSILKRTTASTRVLRPREEMVNGRQETRTKC